MVDFFRRLLDTSDFPARWSCGTWSPALGWLHVVADVLIFAAYFAIPASLFVLVRLRRDIVFPGIFWLFILFILSCGLTHLVEASIFWWPVYRLSGLMKAITAVVSLTTVVALVGVLPQALTIPGIKKANEELTAALSRQRDLNDELERTRSELERRSSEVAVRERRMREAVGAAKACAVAWNIDTGEILWEAGCSHAMRSAGLEPLRSLTHWRDMLGDLAATSLQRDSIAAWEEKRVLHRRFSVPGLEGRWDLRLTATPEPRVAGEPRLMSGMFGLIPLDGPTDA